MQGAEPPLSDPALVAVRRRRRRAEGRESQHRRCNQWWFAATDEDSPGASATRRHRSAWMPTVCDARCVVGLRALARAWSQQATGALLPRLSPPATRSERAAGERSQNWGEGESRGSGGRLGGEGRRAAVSASKPTLSLRGEFTSEQGAERCRRTQRPCEPWMASTERPWMASTVIRARAAAAGVGKRSDRWAGVRIFASRHEQDASELL